MSDLRRMLRYLNPYKKEASIATILVALVVVADLSIPRLVQVIIDDGIAQGDMNIILWTGRASSAPRYPSLTPTSL